MEKLRKANKLVGRDQRDGERKVSHVSPHANFPVAFVRQPFSLTQNARGKQRGERKRERRRAFGHSDELNQAIRRHVRLESNVFVRFSFWLVSTHQGSRCLKIDGTTSWINGRVGRGGKSQPAGSSRAVPWLRQLLFIEQLLYLSIRHPQQERRKKKKKKN